MKTPTLKSGDVPRFAGSNDPKSAAKPTITPGASMAATKAARIAAAHGIDPIVSLSAPVDRPGPPSVAKAAPVAARGDDDLMSQRQ